MRRLALILALLAALAIASSATAANPVLHRFQTGQPIKNVEWRLSGHQRRIHCVLGNRGCLKVGFSSHAYTGPINGVYTLRLAHAVRDTKYRMGYPSRSVRGDIVGRHFLDFLNGRLVRSRAYYLRATKRLAALRRIAAEHARTDCARQVIAVARGLVGIREIPWGSNNGPDYGGHVGVHTIESSTGAYGAPWCVSTFQYIYQKARIGSPRAWAGSIADNSAGAFYVAGWARLHGWARSVPKPAYGVVFLDRLGHMGTVESVTAGGFYSIEGNASDQVLRRFHPFGARPEMFVAVPGCDTG